MKTMPRKMTRRSCKADDMPILVNEPSLEEWLISQEAEMVWNLPSDEAPCPEFILTLWKFPNGRTAIIQIASRGRGWEIYPSLGARDIDDALTAAEEVLHLPMTR
jgi:hypothetical protein